MGDSVYYKQRCDEVILTRGSGDERGVVFDEPMSDDDVADILQELTNGS
jgi:hypothetical protein